jgi:hypothetical protein
LEVSCRSVLQEQDLSFSIQAFSMRRPLRLLYQYLVFAFDEFYLLHQVWISYSFPHQQLAFWH